MKKTILLAFLSLGVFIFIGNGCNLYGGTQSNPYGAPANQKQTQGLPVESNSVNIQNFSFSPSVLTVKKGATVTWTNNDSAPHQIKSDAFNSDSLGNGQSFSFTFNSIGSFDYICSVHPSMTAKVVVE